MGGMDAICVICVAMNLWFVWFLCELVPHPSSARKPQPSLLQVLVGMQKPLLDCPEFVSEWISQGRTSVTNNLLECLPKRKNVQVSHFPRLPCIEHLRNICGGGSISRSCRTRLCIVLCRLLIQKNTSKNTSMNVHAWVASLLLESFHILSEFVSSLPKFTKLESQDWSWTNSADSLSSSAASKSISLISHELLWTWQEKCGFMSRCAIFTECKYCTAAAAFLKATRTLSLSMCCSAVGCSKVFSQQLHGKCGNRHFICRKDCDNIRMLAAFQDLKLLEKLSDPFLIELFLQDAFQGNWGVFCFQSACKNNSRSALGEPSIDTKDVGLGLGRCILWFHLERIVARRRPCVSNGPVSTPTSPKQPPYARGSQTIFETLCRTRLCIVLCRLLIQKEKYIQEYLNECSCLRRLFAFRILSYPFWICFVFTKFTKLESQDWSWTNSADSLSSSAASKSISLIFPRIAVNVAENVRLYVTMCDIHRV